MRSGFDKRTGLTKRKGFRNKTGFKAKTGIDEKEEKQKAKTKRNGLKKKKRKQNRKQDPLKREIHKCDIAFSQLVRLTYTNERGEVKCFTCGKKGFWKKDKIECGHYKSRSHIKTRWMMDNAKPQCTYCNQVLGGNLEMYRKGIIEAAGEEILERLDTESRKVVRATEEDVRDLRLKIEKKVKEIRQQKGL